MATVKTPTVRYIGKSFQTADGYVKTQSWTAPLAASTTAVHAAINSNAVVTSGITSPDVARNVTIVGAGSGHLAAGTVTINGTDIRGATLSETLTLNSNTTVVGSKAFASVTSIDLTAVTGNDVNNTVAVGIGTKLGLSRCLPAANTVFVATTDGVTDTAPTVATSATVVASNTAIMNTAPNASHNYLIAFVSSELTSAA